MARRHTQKKGGYRGSLGGAPMHGALTTGATQELNQMGGVRHHSRATKKAIQKALNKQQKAANAAAAKNAMNAAKMAENNVQRVKNERKKQNREMIDKLVQQLENKQRRNTARSTSFIPPSVHSNQNINYHKMVNDLVGK
jgi:pyruvate/2-oxoglutarate dehydrogenase complex dihydrolipoamide acyltransferase (E2) component